MCPWKGQHSGESASKAKLCVKAQKKEEGTMEVKGWKEEMVYGIRKWWRGACEGEVRDSNVLMHLFLYVEVVS